MYVLLEIVIRHPEYEIKLFTVWNYLFKMEFIMLVMRQIQLIPKPKLIIAEEFFV
jgi:hypothetical protein